MEFFLVQTLNGISYGLLLFMLSSGLTLVFSLMGVLNFAHASFYMLGAYFAYQISAKIGFWPALVARAAAGGRARHAGRALRPAPGAQARPRRRAAVHLRPRLPDRGGGAPDLGPLGGRVPRAARARRPAVPDHRLAVPDLPRLHDAGVGDDAGVDLARAHAHAHRPGDPGGAHAPADGRGARPQRAARVHAGVRRRLRAGGPRRA